MYLLDGVVAHADNLGRLGPHTTGAGCLYLEAVYPAVLCGVLVRSLAWAEGGGSADMRLTVTS